MKYNLWPKPKISIFRSAHYSDAERVVSNRWRSNSYPVLVSSARLGLALILRAKGLGRCDNVDIYPLISPCVSKTISSVSMINNRFPKSNNDWKIIYHQYGFIQKTKYSHKLIEDAVDSLCMPDAKIFPNGGEFEVWSLPKIISSFSGAIIWCKSEDDASKIKFLRDQNKKDKKLSWLLRFIGHYSKNIYYFWEGIEIYRNASLPSFAIGEIIEKIESIDPIIEDRIKKVELMRSFICDNLYLSNDRLPSLIPIFNTCSTNLLKIRKAGFDVSIRNLVMQQAGNVRIKPFIPLPIHQNVPVDLIYELFETIEK